MTVAGIIIAGLAVAAWGMVLAGAAADWGRRVEELRGDQWRGDE